MASRVSLYNMKIGMLHCSHTAHNIHKGSQHISLKLSQPLDHMNRMLLPAPTMMMTLALPTQATPVHHIASTSYMPMTQLMACSGYFNASQARLLPP